MELELEGKFRLSLQKALVRMADKGIWEYQSFLFLYRQEQDSFALFEYSPFPSGDTLKQGIPWEIGEPFTRLDKLTKISLTRFSSAVPLEEVLSLPIEERERLYEECYISALERADIYLPKTLTVSVLTDTAKEQRCLLIEHLSNQIDEQLFLAQSSDWEQGFIRGFKVAIELIRLQPDSEWIYLPGMLNIWQIHHLDAVRHLNYSDDVQRGIADAYVYASAEAKKMLL